MNFLSSHPAFNVNGEGRAVVESLRLQDQQIHVGWRVGWEPFVVKLVSAERPEFPLAKIFG